MNKLLMIGFLSLTVFLVSSCGGGGGSSSASTNTTTTATTVNNNPAISSYVANPTLLTAGASSTLTVTATDADNDALTYEYSASGGTVSGSGASVTWTSSSTASAGATFTVSVTVKDGKCTSGCPSSVKTFEIGTSSTIPTFSSVQTSFFTPTCATAACHGGTQSPALIAGQAYGNIVNVNSTFSAGKKIVLPGESDSSALYLRVSGTSQGTQMPKGLPALSASDQNKIRDWIRAGAPNN